MSKIVVTTGQRYTDIDGFACCIAYKEIPQVETIAVIPGELNLSVNSTIRAWKTDYLTNITPGDYNFVITDVSEEDQLAPFVDKKRIIEIYDHHFGFEKYWTEKLGEKAKIEPVGSCATLIWEEFKKRNQNSSPSQPILDPQLTTHPHPISPTAANLLYTAILSNTLNFKASITTDRDKKAFEELKQFTTLPANWAAEYYHDIETDVYANPDLAIINDTKIQIIQGQKCAIAQVELWNSKEFISSFVQTINGVMKSFDTELWFLTSPSISESRNYIYTTQETVKNWLRSVLAVDFFGGNIGMTDRLWLRKEILKKIQ